MKSYTKPNLKTKFKKMDKPARLTLKTNLRAGTVHSPTEKGQECDCSVLISFDNE